MRRACARAALSAFLVLGSNAPALAQRQTIASRDAIYRWTEAVNTHVPGRPDAAAAAMARMTYAERLELNAAYPLFMQVLRERSIVFTRSELDKAVTRLARTVRGNPGVPAFLKRAAILHADAAIFARELPPAPDDAPIPAPSTESIGGIRTRIPPQRTPPLLTSGRVALTRDGQVVGGTALNWHLPFARSLLDELLTSNDRHTLPPHCSDEIVEAMQASQRIAAGCRVIVVSGAPVTREDRAFVGTWYHGVAAFLFANGMNGDATHHLRDAAAVLPDDPRLLFDRGTYAEAFGLPIYQAARATSAAKPQPVGADLPDEGETNAVAERMYRRTLDVDPSYVEARIRLARLLGRRGRHTEADVEIHKALSSRPAGVTGYYALIIGGRIASALGRHEQALQRYRDASALFGRAQAALLGASHAALMLAEVRQTLAPLEQLQDATDQRDYDPWWDYAVGAGRDVDALLAVLWKARLR